MPPTDVSEWLARIRAEYLEMPGLQLTAPQMWRLWRLDKTTCDAVVEALVEDGFLIANGHGAYRLARSNT
jgi:hypothetical protein